MLRIYEYRRTLPHFQKDYKALFVTFASYHRWNLPGPARSLVLDACRHVDGSMCTLFGVVVMPDHVHLALAALSDENGPITLEEIMQKLKSESAHRINKFLGRKGHVWQDESFDHVLRREEGIEAKLECLSENPVRAGLVASAGEYCWTWLRPIDDCAGGVARAHTTRAHTTRAHTRIRL